MTAGRHLPRKPSASIPRGFVAWCTGWIAWQQPEHLPGEGYRRAGRSARASPHAPPVGPRRRGDGDADRTACAQHLRPVRHRQAHRRCQGAVSILGGAVGRHRHQHRALDAGGTRRSSSGMPRSRRLCLGFKQNGPKCRGRNFAAHHPIGITTPRDHTLRLTSIINIF